MTDPKALAVFADAARQLGAELSDAEAEEALRYVVHLRHLRALLSRHSLPEVCPACGVSSLDMGPTSRPHDSDCAIWSAIEALDLQQGHVAVAVAFDEVREMMARRVPLDVVNGVAQRDIAEGEVVRWQVNARTEGDLRVALTGMSRQQWDVTPSAIADARQRAILTTLEEATDQLVRRNIPMRSISVRSRTQYGAAVRDLCVDGEPWFTLHIDLGGRLTAAWLPASVVTPTPTPPPPALDVVSGIARRDIWDIDPNASPEDDMRLAIERMRGE